MKHPASDTPRGNARDTRSGRASAASMSNKGAAAAAHRGISENANANAHARTNNLGGSGEKRPSSASKVAFGSGRSASLGVSDVMGQSLDFKDLAPSADSSYLRRRTRSDASAPRSGSAPASAAKAPRQGDSGSTCTTAIGRSSSSSSAAAGAGGAGAGAAMAAARSRPATAGKSPGRIQIPGGGSMASIVEEMARKLGAAETQLHERDEKIEELKEALQRSQELSREVLSARRAAKEAVEDMAEQNAKLIQAYMDKKKEFKEVQKDARHASEVEAEAQRLREENLRLQQANAALQRRVADLEQASRLSSSSGTGASAGSSLGGASRAAGDDDPKQRDLEGSNRRLEEENKALRDERAALLERTVQQDKLEHHRHMGNVAYQDQSFSEALRHYSAAIDTGVAEGPASAVLHSNRAACFLSLAKYLDCIYDCTTSVCLDPSYQRSYQRRSEAYAALGDFSHAVSDLKALCTMTGRGDLEGPVQGLHDRAKQSPGVDHYKVLAIDAASTDNDVRLSYKQLALKFHPDKATHPQQKAVAEGLFKLLSDAKRALGSAEARAAFDQSRKK